MKTKQNTNNQDSVSLIACCMNRNDHLEQVLPNWLEFDQIKEIVIVDWSSDEPLEAIVSKRADPRILLARVDDESSWVLPYAANLAARLSSGSRILKLDTDTKLAPTFFEDNPLSEGLFYQGNGFDDRGLTGMLYLYREDYFAVNGFSEYLRNYAWEDTDIFTRLMLVRGLANRYMKEGSATHIPHSDARRMANQSSLIGFEDCDLPQLVQDTLAVISHSSIAELGETEEDRIARLRRLMFEGGADETAFLNQISRHPIYNIMRTRYIAEEFPWTSDHSMARFDQLEERPGYLRFARDKDDEYPVPAERVLAAKRYGLTKLFYSRFPALRSAVNEFPAPTTAIPIEQRLSPVL